MRIGITTMMLLGALVGGASIGCTADVHDNELNTNISLDDATVSFDTDVDVDQVQQGESLPIQIKVDGAFLIEPSETPPPDKVDIAAHLQFYLDDVDSEALLITAQTSVQFTVPASTPEGDHKVICRLHHHDGTPTDVKFELSIKVHAQITG